MNAILPESMEGPSIAGMLVGETAYTVPWAMFADDSRRLWLNPDYAVHKKPGGTRIMKIKREHNGFRVWPPPDHHYAPGSDWKSNLPVVKLEGIRR